jgi:hypothetical protein
LPSPFNDGVQDLGLGVFNARLKEDGETTSSSDEDSSDSDSESSDESSGEDDDGDGIPSALKIGQATAPKRKKGSLIEMLDDSGSAQAAGEASAQTPSTTE